MWHLVIKNSNLQYRLFILKILIFETSRDPWVQLQRRHHYFINFCTTKKRKIQENKDYLTKPLEIKSSPGLISLSPAQLKAMNKFLLICLAGAALVALSGESKHLD